MNLFFRKRNIDISKIYPDDLIYQWNFLCNELKKKVNSDKSIITFGSFPIGDFLWLECETTKVYISDFEFTILFKSDVHLTELSTINTIVEKFNRNQLNKHWGFNCNVVFEQWGDFLKRINNDVFFRNELIKSCSFIYSKNPVPKEFKGISTGEISSKHLKKVLKSVCYNLLIVLDERFISNKTNFEEYCGAIISKSILKLGKLWYSYKGFKINDYFSLINNNNIDLDDPTEKKCLNRQYQRLFVNRSFFKVDSQLQKCHDNLITKISTEIEFENSVISTTRKYLNMISNNSIEQKVNNERISLVWNYLRDKGPHYNFYRNYYL